MRWARCPDEGRLHLLTLADVVAAVGLTITDSAGALCLACVAGIPPPAQTLTRASDHRATRLVSCWWVVVWVANRTDTIPITCSLDGQAHDVTDDNLAAGQHGGEYRALCDYLVTAAALATPIGRLCPECTAISVTATTGPARRSWHHRLGWLWRILHLSRNTGAGAGVWWRP